MNTLTKILAPAAIALFAFNAQAANVDTGGESYQGNVVVASASPSQQVASDERVTTGGEAYVGVANQRQPFDSPASNAGLSARELQRLYIG